MVSLIEMEQLYRTGEAAKLLGVHPMTLRRWIKAGKVKAKRTVGGEFRVPESEIMRLLGEREVVSKAVIYARVSSSDQKDDLERQVKYLQEYCSAKGYKVMEVLTDVASGLNEKRRGLRKLFKLVENKSVDIVVLTYKDRLTRFGFSYLEEFFKSYRVKVEVIFGEEPKDMQQELVEDLIAIVTSFAGRLYGMRSHKKKKVVESVKQAIRDC